jgi:hypothetical protein
MSRKSNAPGLAPAGREEEPKAAATVARYASRLRKLQQTTVENIITMGKVLLEAKAALPHGEFTAMVEAELGWNMSQAQRLMKIARHPILTNTATLPLLPARREVLYKLTQVPEEKISEAIEAGEITPSLTMNTAKRLARVTPPGGPVGPVRVVTSPQPDPGLQGRRNTYFRGRKSAMRGNRMMENLVTLIQGHVETAQDIDVTTLDHHLVPVWADDITAAARALTDFARRLKDGWTAGEYQADAVQKRELGPPLDGMAFAHLAVMDLEKIRDDDVERKPAFAFVKEWIDARGLVP